VRSAPKRNEIKGLQGQNRRPRVGIEADLTEATVDPDLEVILATFADGRSFTVAEASEAARIDLDYAGELLERLRDHPVNGFTAFERYDDRATRFWKITPPVLTQSFLIPARC
jgi:hypothetical protein